jgi:Bacterial Ig domain/Purple acid Phosphatase, N-terminal domain
MYHIKAGMGTLSPMPTGLLQASEENQKNMKLRLPGRALLTSLSLAGAMTLTAGSASADFPGGFIRKSYDAPDRPRLSQSQVQNFVPNGRGKFTFPAPYNTEGVRITVPSDCGGSDCVDYVSYHYWKNSNNHQNSDSMYIFASLNRNRGGTEGPTLFNYNKLTDAVTKVGPLFDSSSKWSWASGNGWYFSAAQPTKLYVYYWGDPTLYRYDVETHVFDQVLDITSRTDIFGSNRNITQAHSSDDDKVHSFTIQDSGFSPLGCGVYNENTGRYQFFPKTGDFNECNLDGSGRWLIIIDGSADNDNYIVDLQNNSEKVILNQDGRLGHLDTGFGYMVGNSGSVPVPQATLLYKFPLATTSYPVGPVVFYNVDWNTGIVNHASHQNRKPGVPPEQQYACGSNLDSNPSRENEIACFRMDGSYDALFVAPVMTDMNAPGGDCDYCKYPKGNLDVTGQYFIWTSNMYGNRLDMFVAKVPSQLLTGVSTPTTPPPTSTPPAIIAVSAATVDASSATIVWTTSTNSDSQVEYGTTTSYGSTTSLNGNSVKSHMQVVSNLTPATTYHYRVKSKDSSGTALVSSDATFTTTTSGSSGGGSSVVSIVTPSSGANVKGKIKLTASASGSQSLAGVQFQIDGQNVGSARPNGKLTVNWNAASVAPGLHIVTAVARDTAGNTSVSAPVMVNVIAGGKGATIAPFTENVVWANAVNASASGNSIQKTGGCDGCEDAGATSAQQFTGDGYVEFTASETTTQRAIGLSAGNKDTSYADIDFAVVLWNGNGGYVEIYENGVYKAGTVPYSPGDVFRIEVNQGVVRYSKNGSVFYTSLKKPKSALLADISLRGAGATLVNAVIAQTP